jgi:hypothetical protein
VTLVTKAALSQSSQEILSRARLRGLSLSEAAALTLAQASATAGVQPSQVIDEFLDAVKAVGASGAIDVETLRAYIDDAAQRPPLAQNARLALHGIEVPSTTVKKAAPAAQLRELVEKFLQTDLLPQDDPLRAGIEHFLLRRSNDPRLARQADPLVEHLRVASGGRQGMQVFDLRTDTGPNHAETIVLGCEALIHLKQVNRPEGSIRNLSSLLDPVQGSFRNGKDDLTYITQIAQVAIQELQVASWFAAMRFT